MALKLISFGVRASLAGGFIYWTKEEGLWGESTKTKELYQEMYNQTSNLLKDTPVVLPTVPSPTEIGAFVRVNWNKAVYATFNGIVAAPCKVTQWTIQGYEAAAKLLDQPAQEIK